MKNLLIKLKRTYFLLSLTLYAQVSSAALPTAKPSTAAQGGDYIGLGRETAKDTVELVVQVIGALILAIAAWVIIVSFKETQDKKSTWTEFGKTLIGALVVCLIGIILLTQADSVF